TPQRRLVPNSSVRVDGSSAASLTEGGSCASSLPPQTVCGSEVGATMRSPASGEPPPGVRGRPPIKLRSVKLQNTFGQMCAGFGLGCILVATLTPIPGGVEASATTPIWCLICGDHGGVDVILNVILFVPFALGLRAAGTPARRVIALAALLSLFVESMQF